MAGVEAGRDQRGGQAGGEVAGVRVPVSAAAPVFGAAAFALVSRWVVNIELLVTGCVVVALLVVARYMSWKRWSRERSWHRVPPIEPPHPVPPPPPLRSRSTVEPAPIVLEDCGCPAETPNCNNCRLCIDSTLAELRSKSKAQFWTQAFVVCATCGNKRCPKATDHRLACSNSNAPGQEGSCYE